MSDRSRKRRAASGRHDEARQSPFVQLLGAGLLVGAATNIFVALSSVPAGNQELRQDGILGTWRVGSSAALFDQADYYFQIGFGYANADDSFVSNEDPDNFEALAQERAQLAVDNLSRSLARAPGNAHAWTLMAWSLASLDRIEEARNAMMNSWRIAPYSFELAGIRPEFTALIDELIADEVLLGDLQLAPLSEVELAGASRDIVVLLRNNEFFAEEIADTSPLLTDMYVNLREELELDIEEPAN